VYRKTIVFPVSNMIIEVRGEMASKEENPCLIVFMGCLLLAVATLINGVVISLMWEWFVVPLGAASISWIHAIGLGILNTYLTTQPPMKDDEYDGGAILSYWFVRPVAALFAGYLVFLIMQ